MYSVPQRLGCCSQPHGGRACQAGGVEPRGSGSGACVPSLCPALLLNLSARVAWACRPSSGPSAPCLNGVCRAQIQTQILCVSSWTCAGWAAFSGSPSIQYQPPVVLIAIFSQKQHQAKTLLGPKAHPVLQPWASPSLLSGSQLSPLHSGHPGGLGAHFRL